jgi:hypothetical protein
MNNDNFNHELNFKQQYSDNFIVNNLDDDYIDACSIDIERQIELNNELKQKELTQPVYSLSM